MRHASNVPWLPLRHVMVRFAVDGGRGEARVRGDRATGVWRRDPADDGFHKASMCLRCVCKALPYGSDHRYCHITPAPVSPPLPSPPVPFRHWPSPLGSGLFFPRPPGGGKGPALPSRRTVNVHGWGSSEPSLCRVGASQCAASEAVFDGFRGTARLGAGRGSGWSRGIQAYSSPLLEAALHPRASSLAAVPDASSHEKKRPAHCLSRVVTSYPVPIQLFDWFRWIQ